MASCSCGAQWTGRKIEHCPACHETFTSTAAGDAHRVGDHAIRTGPDRRRCLTVAEMDASKKVHRNERGQWASGAEPWAYSP